MRVEIVSKDNVLSRFANQIGAVGEEKGRKALARAVNRVTTTVEGRVARAIGKQSSIPTKIIRTQIRKKLAAHKGGGAIEGHVIASGSPLPLKVFNPKQFSWGVRAKVWGQMERFPSHFMHGGRWNSGKLIAGGHVFINTRGPNANSKRNNAIEKQFGPSVPEEMVRDEAARVFHHTVQTMLPKRVAHELSRLLP